MSSTLIDFVEARLDAMNGARGGMELRIPSPPPITSSGNSSRTSLRKRHVKPPRRNSKLTDSLHESFGWLEEYVDVKYLEMMRRDSSSLSSHSLNSSGHNRCLSRGDSSSLELKGLPDGKSHRRTHSRRDSLLIGIAT
jgi:hypothetical protein